MPEPDPPPPRDQPTTDDAVRRLLAEARHGEPLPPDVAQRLDVLLGELVEERTAQHSRPGDVVDLGLRRHRTRTLLLVAAAAAAVAIGVGGITGLRDQVGGGSDTASSAQDSAAGGSTAEPESQSESQSESQPESQSGTRSEAPAQGDAGGGSLAAPTAAAPVVLTSGDVTAQVQAALRPPGAGGSDDAYDSRLDLTFDDCAPPAGTPYDVVRAATYDGAPGVLAAAAPSDGRQRVDVFLCGATEPVRSVTVDAPR